MELGTPGATGDGGGICRLVHVWLYTCTPVCGSINPPTAYGGCHDFSGFNGGNGKSCAYAGDMTTQEINGTIRTTIIAAKIFFIMTVNSPNIVLLRINYTVNMSRLLDWMLTGN